MSTTVQFIKRHPLIAGIPLMLAAALLLNAARAQTPPEFSTGTARLRQTQSVQVQN